VTFGCGQISVPGRQVAVKTGTSEPYDPKGPNAGKIGETWAFGYTPDYVVGIWAGNSDNSPVVNIYSTSISFRAMRDTMQAAYDGRPSTQFARPAGIVEETICVPSGLRPTSLCGRTSKDLFVKDAFPEKEDDWWRIVRLDRRNGLLATPGTPPQFIEERVMLVPPAELLKTEDDRKRAEEWSQALNLPLAPTDASTAPALGSSGGPIGVDLPVIIFSPSAGAQLFGSIQVTGRASSNRFQYYRLEYGRGANPSSWSQIAQYSTPVASGVLGTWDTLSLTPGTYTLRLVVRDRDNGDLTATVAVNVGPPATATPVATTTPVAAP
jgi:hypothetical protein